MRGFLVELRKSDNPEFVVGSGSLSPTAKSDQWLAMANKLLGKSKTGSYFAVVYDADWSDCSNPVYTEVDRFEMTGTVPEPVPENTPDS